MFRMLGNLTLLLCMMWLLCMMCPLFAAAAESTPAENAPAPATKPCPTPTAEAGPARMVRIELLIADTKWSDADKGVLADPTADHKGLIQRLEQAGKLDALTRVQLTTVENQQASVHIGQRVPRVTASQRAPAGQVSSVTMENVGLRLSVAPLVRRDERGEVVVMQIDIERSRLGSQEEGPIIAKPSDGEAIRLAPMETFTARTTVSARNGQSVVLCAQQTRQQARQRELVVVVIPDVLGTQPSPAGK